MKFQLDHAPLCLTGGSLLRISDGKGRTLRVLAGKVWITQEGSLDDLFLGAGESCTFDGPSAVVTAEGRGNASATVLFDVPLSVQSQTRDPWWWSGLPGLPRGGAAPA